MIKIKKLVSSLLIVFLLFGNGGVVYAQSAPTPPSAPTAPAAPTPPPMPTPPSAPTAPAAPTPPPMPTPPSSHPLPKRAEVIDTGPGGQEGNSGAGATINPGAAKNGAAEPELPSWP